MRVIHWKRLVMFLVMVAVIFLAGYFCGFFTDRYLETVGRLNREMPIFFVEKNRAEVCLTFDISWGEKTLPFVLKVLAEHQVPATFFLSGPWAVRHPEAVRTIDNGAHEIASHGDRHINLSEYPKEVVQKNIAQAHQDLLTVARRVAPFFRPPNGDYDDIVIDTARELGFETVIWSVDSLDWKNPGPNYMIQRVLSKTNPGAIILCHASDSSKEIHLALPGIITGLRSKGYKFVTLSQLLTGGNPGRRDPR